VDDQCSKHNWLLEASLTPVSKLNMGLFLNHKRDALLQQYFTRQLSPKTTSKCLTRIIAMRKQIVRHRIAADVKPLALTLSRVGTHTDTLRALQLMKEIVWGIPHPLHAGELGALHESLGHYTLAMQYFRQELIARMHTQPMGNTEVTEETDTTIASCVRNKAWRVQDDLLAEKHFIKNITRIPEENIQRSTTFYLQTWKNATTNGGVLRGGAAMKDLNATQLKQVQWLWTRKEVIFIEMKHDVVLLDPGSGTFGTFNVGSGNRGCVIFARSIEHMESWRKMSRSISQAGNEATASWSWSSHNNARVKNIGSTKPTIDPATKALYDVLQDNNTTVVPLFGGFAYNNYFHWVAEVMARATVFRQECLHRTDTRFVAMFPAWTLHGGEQRMAETAALLGIPRDRIVVVPPKAKKLHIKSIAFIEWRREGNVECPSYFQHEHNNTQLPLLPLPPQCWRTWNNSINPNDLHIPPASVLRNLRKTVWHYSTAILATQQAPPLPRQRPYIVFAHRGNATESVRSFAGGQTTIDTLTTLLKHKLALTHGIVVLDPSRNSLVEQVQLFRNADGVVGPHGAALANIIYCKPGAIVVELPTTEHAGMRFFQDMSAALGLLHAVVPSVACDKLGRYCLAPVEMEHIVETVFHMLKM